MLEIFIENVQAMKSFYKVLPNLENVQVSAIKLIYDGPTIGIGVQFPTFPDFRAKKWPAHASVFMAHFSFSFEEICIKKFGTQNFCNIMCSPIENTSKIRVFIVGPDMHIEFVAPFKGRADSFSVV